jgi:hypothetical protein
MTGEPVRPLGVVESGEKRERNAGTSEPLLEENGTVSVPAPPLRPSFGVRLVEQSMNRLRETVKSAGIKEAM